MKILSFYQTKLSTCTTRVLYFNLQYKIKYKNQLYYKVHHLVCMCNNLKHIPVTACSRKVNILNELKIVKLDAHLICIYTVQQNVFM